MRNVAVFFAIFAAASGFGQTHFSVKVEGKGKPILLIPGLTCDGSVWDATVAKLKTNYECHVLTLAGFAGKPAVAGPFLEPVRDDIIAYVKAKGLKHPAVIGHSLGGFMVFSLGSKEPTLFGPLIAVDGVPWLTSLGNPAATMDSAKTAAEYMVKGMAAATSDQFKKSTRAALTTQITDPKEIERVGALAEQSDPTAVGTAMKEMLTTDLRDEIAKIKSPVLLFAAGAWAQTPEQKAALEKAYGAQVAKLPGTKIVPIWGAKHFVMLDQPSQFLEETERFLKENWKE